MAYITLSSTSSEVIVSIDGLQKEYQYSNRTFEVYLSETSNGTPINSVTGPIGAHVESIGPFGFVDLDPDTKYYVKGWILYPSSGNIVRSPLNEVSIWTKTKPSGGILVPDNNQIPVITKVTRTWSSANKGFYVDISAYDDDGEVQGYYYSATSSGTKINFTPGIGGKTFSPGSIRYFYVKDDEGDYSEYYKYTFPEVNPPKVSISINSGSNTILYNDKNYAYGNIYLVADITAGSASYANSDVKWYIDNVLQDTGTSFTFDPSTYSDSVSIKVKITDSNGLSADSSLTIYIPAAPSDLASLDLYNNGSSDSTVSGTTPTDFNSSIYLTASFSSLSTYQLPITRLDVYIGSREKGATTPSTSLTYQTLKTLTFSSHPSTTAVPNLSLLDDVVPRNYEFFLKTTLTDKAGRQVTNYFGPYYRIQLPYFSTGDITAAFVSNFVPPILYSKLPTSTLLFEFPFGWAYGKTQANASPTTLSINCVSTFNGTESTVSLKASGADFSNSYFTYESDSANSCNRISITPSSLITYLNSQFSDDLTTFDANTYFTFKAENTDAFNKKQTLTLCKDLNQNILNSGYWVNFGAAPVMDTDTSKYSITHYVQDHFTSSSISNQLSSLTWNSYSNMINPQEKLFFKFPVATDQNGNDKISQYNLKIYRSDNLDDFNDFTTINLNNFQILNTFVKNESGNFDNLQIDSTNSSYTYEHRVPNYSISKFVCFAISATDNTGLESNTVVIPIKMIICRLQEGTAVINSCDRTSKELYKYTLKFKVTDLGGNKFNNSAYTIQAYNNLTRNIPGLSESSQSQTPKLLYYANFTVQKDESKKYLTSYTNNVEYLSLLNENSIPLDFSSKVDQSNQPSDNAKYTLTFNISYDPIGATTNYVYAQQMTVYTVNEPTLSIRKNYLGINSQNFDEGELLKITALSPAHSLIILNYESNKLIFDLAKPGVKNIILSDLSD